MNFAKTRRRSAHGSTPSPIPTIASTVLTLLLVSLPLISASPTKTTSTTSTTIRTATAGLTLPRFKDVSLAAGIDHSMGPRIKFGGPVVADLDGDGHVDLLFGHHDNFRVELYFSNGDGTFSRDDSFRLFRDLHSFAPYRARPSDKGLRFAVCRGRSDNHPDLFQVYGNRTVEDVTKATGVDFALGRGRTAVFMSLRPGKYKFPDVVFTNARLFEGSSHHHGLMGTRTGVFKPSSLGEFSRSTNWFAHPIDVDNDGQMELVGVHNLTAWKVVGNFQLRDITHEVFPRRLPHYGVVATVEFDYDGDGIFDLYVARTATSDLRFLNRRGRVFHDILLKGMPGGGYTDVTETAGIPDWFDTRGVTAGDFNNDGYEDLVVFRHTHPAELLLNCGNGSFVRAERTPWNLAPASTHGDMGVAVDYDMDGRLDVIVAQGDYYNRTHSGFFRIFRNTLPNPARTHSVLVRVWSSPSGRASSMYAVVTAYVGARVIIRRVGSPGRATGGSYIETVHIGLGADARSIRRLMVRWVDGKKETQRGVKRGSRVEFGVIPGAE